MSGTYDLRLVTLSVAIAIMASFASLDLAGRIKASHRWPRFFWLSGGAAAMGAGIWSMHYVGMLAYKMPMVVLYDIPTVGLSLLTAIAASAAALFTMGRQSIRIWQMLAGGTAMGLGIAAMHYIGMAAMRMAATIQYNSGLVFVSVVLAIGISLVALVLAFQVRNEQSLVRKCVSAVIMGLAIPVMHYTGMAAARFHPSDSIPKYGHAVGISGLGIAVISFSTLLVLSLVIMSAFLDRWRRAQRMVTEAARHAELYFRNLAEAIPSIIWTARPDGYVDFHNKRWHEYVATHSDGTGETWVSVLHPDDRELSIQKWKDAQKSGEEYESEYRLRRGSDGSYRCHLVRAVPVYGSDRTIIKWFGTCTDIDDQKRSQQILQDEVRRRTEELVQANVRLNEEMQAREKAQRDLNQQTEQLVNELTNQSRTSDLLGKMGDLLHTCNTVQEALSVILGFAPKVFSNLGGAIMLLNSSKNLLEVTGKWEPCELSMTVFEPSACWALRTGHRHIVVAADSSARCAHSDNVAATLLCIPIQAHGDALGVIHFQASETLSQIQERDLSISNTFAEQIGLSIANIRLREALKNQSIRDALTGLFNRRYLEETFERELHRAVRGKQSLSVVMFDLDHFKRFNDTFGHEAGDTVLHEMGAFLYRNTRTDDIACRYGGEEFVLIFPNSSLDAAEKRAEQLRSSIKNLNIIHRGQPLGPVTISVGIAAYPLNGSSPSQLIANADAALYQAKRAGRDQIVLAQVVETETITI
jgi:diguanylate cyclase (GGDEF)-like protein/PAS domain S-box-containing protein